MTSTLQIAGFILPAGKGRVNKTSRQVNLFAALALEFVQSLSGVYIQALSRLPLGVGLEEA